MWVTPRRNFCVWGIAFALSPEKNRTKPRRRRFLLFTPVIGVCKDCLSRWYFTSAGRGIGKSFQLAITAPRINLIGYGIAHAQSYRPAAFRANNNAPGISTDGVARGKFPAPSPKSSKADAQCDNYYSVPTLLQGTIAPMRHVQTLLRAHMKSSNRLHLHNAPMQAPSTDEKGQLQSLKAKRAQAPYETCGGRAHGVCVLCLTCGR